jgi:hypothetical protein
VKARTILVIGWVGLMLYAYPGYMSYDSVVQLIQARSGVLGDAHPPLMSALWGLTDRVIAGPLPMLVLQVTCFLAGVYLILKRFLSPRAAAICATLVLWFPPIAVVLAVIWKDSQMVAFLVLGTALLLSPRRGVNITGLVLLSAATALRYNALAITLPLVVLLFVWNPAHRWWLRGVIALGAWLALTLAAMLVTRALTTEGEHTYAWHDSVALCDIVGTLRYAPDLPDAELREDLAGTPLVETTDVQLRARSSFRPEDLPERKVQTFGTGGYTPALWVTTFHVFSVPETMDQRAAIARAWKAIVLSHPAAYLEYRWHIFRERIQLGTGRIPSGAYIWFTDVLDLSGSAQKIGHTARASKVQTSMQSAMLWFGTSLLFRPYVYLVLSLVLVVLCRKHRELLALVLSGVANEAALFILAPTIDYRYSVWLVISTMIVVIALIAKRATTSADRDT